MKRDLAKINTKYLLLTVLIFLRVIFIYYATKYEPTYLKKDSNHYLILSESIRNYFFNDELTDYWMPTTRTMGYPILLSLLGKIVNIENYLYINLIVDLISSVILFKIIGQLTENKFIQYLGLVLFLMNPNVLISSSQIMTESLSLLFFLLSFRYLFKGDTRSILIAGIYIGIFSFIKPMGHILLLLAIIVGAYWFRFRLKKILLLSCIPVVCMLGASYNNYLQYESFFYSTSSYFHIQWFNGASSALCNKLDFDQLEVVEPGYVFDEWKKTLDNKTLSTSGLFIDELKESSSDGLFKNIRCKFISVSHSIVWNFFGVRSANWSETYLSSSFVKSVIYYSYLYVLLSASSLLYFIFSERRPSLYPIIFLIVAYTLITSITLPYGNARTRVLIEPFNVIITSCLLYEISFKKREVNGEH